MIHINCQQINIVILTLGTINLRRRQFFAIFDPSLLLSATVGIPAKCPPHHGGFQLLDLIIPELKSHVIPYKFKRSHWWKIHL